MARFHGGVAYISDELGVVGLSSDLGLFGCSQSMASRNGGSDYDLVQVSCVFVREEGIAD